MNKNVIDNFAGFAEAAHSASIEAGWYEDLETGEWKDRNRGEMYCLMHSELSEAMEGYRKSLQDDKLPHRPMIEVELADFVIRLADYAAYRKLVEQVRGAVNMWPGFEIGNIAEVLACVHASVSYALAQQWNEDAHLGGALGLVVRIADHLGLDLEGAVYEKMAFNSNRPDHKRENRKLANGKRF